MMPELETFPSFKDGIEGWAKLWERGVWRGIPSRTVGEGNFVDSVMGQ